MFDSSFSNKPITPPITANCAGNQNVFHKNIKKKLATVYEQPILMRETYIHFHRYIDIFSKQFIYFTICKREGESVCSEG